MPPAARQADHPPDCASCSRPPHLIPLPRVLLLTSVVALGLHLAVTFSIPDEHGSVRDLCIVKGAYMCGSNTSTFCSSVVKEVESDSNTVRVYQALGHVGVALVGALVAVAASQGLTESLRALRHNTQALVSMEFKSLRPLPRVTTVEVHNLQRDCCRLAEMIDELQKCLPAAMLDAFDDADSGATRSGGPSPRGSNFSRRRTDMDSAGRPRDSAWSDDFDLPQRDSIGPELRATPPGNPLDVRVATGDHLSRSLSGSLPVLSRQTQYLVRVELDYPWTNSLQDGGLGMACRKQVTTGVTRFVDRIAEVVHQRKGRLHCVDGSVAVVTWACGGSSAPRSDLSVDRGDAVVSAAVELRYELEVTADSVHRQRTFSMRIQPRIAITQGMCMFGTIGSKHRSLVLLGAPVSLAAMLVGVARARGAGIVTTANIAAQISDARIQNRHIDTARVPVSRKEDEPGDMTCVRTAEGTVEVCQILGKADVDLSPSQLQMFRNGMQAYCRGDMPVAVEMLTRYRIEVDESEDQVAHSLLTRARNALADPAHPSQGEGVKTNYFTRPLTPSEHWEQMAWEEAAEVPTSGSGLRSILQRATLSALHRTSSPHIVVDPEADSQQSLTSPTPSMPMASSAKWFRPSLLTAAIPRTCTGSTSETPSKSQRRVSHFSQGDLGGGGLTASNLSSPRIYSGSRGLSMRVAAPKSVVVTVKSATNLIAADVRSSDPFAIVKVSPLEHSGVDDGGPVRTRVIKGSLNPEWNESFEFQIDRAQVEREPLKIEVDVFDWDLVGDNDFIGHVETSLSKAVLLAAAGAPVEKTLACTTRPGVEEDEKLADKDLGSVSLAVLTGSAAAKCMQEQAKFSKASQMRRENSLLRRVHAAKQAAEKFSTRVQLDMDRSLARTRKILLVWNVAHLAVLMYNAFFVPLDASFNPRVTESGDLTVYNWFGLAFDSFLDVSVYYVSIFLKFRTPYEDGGRVVEDPVMIRLNYLKTWFLVDLVGCFPLELIGMLVDPLSTQQGKPGLVWFDKRYRFGRLVNILHLPEYFTLLFDRVLVNINPVLARITRFLVCTFYLLHFLTCVHYQVIERDYNGGQPITDPDTPRHAADNAAYKYNGIADLPNQPFALRYTLSMDWAVHSLAGFSVGYPTSDAQTSLSLASSCVGVVVYATVIAVVAQLVQSLYANEDEFRRRIDQVYDALKHLKLPHEFRNEVVEFYKNLFATGALTAGDGTEEQLFSEVPEELRERIEASINSMIVGHVPMFASARGDQDVMKLLLRELKPQLVTAGHYVCQKGEEGSEMYFITKGSCGVYDDEDREVAVIPAGKFFGEICLFYQVTRTATIRTTTFTQLYVLSSESLETVLRAFPEMCFELITAAEIRRPPDAEESDLLLLARTLWKMVQNDLEDSVAVSVQSSSISPSHDKEAVTNSAIRNRDERAPSTASGNASPVLMFSNDAS